MDIVKYLPTILKFSGLFSRACSKYHSVELISVVGIFISATVP